MDNDDFSENDNTENNGYTIQTGYYINLKRKCTRLLQQLNTNEYENIRNTLLTNQIKYQNKYDLISRQIYALIKNLIDMHKDLNYNLNDMKNMVQEKIDHFDRIHRSANYIINYERDDRALNDITSKHSSIYNTRR